MMAKRRASGAGHYYQLPSGHWRWIIQYKGERRGGTQFNRAKAMLAASQALVELGADHPASIKATVEELLTAWQAEHEREWSPTYRVDVAHVCSKLPRGFLDRDIATVEPAVIATLQRSLLKQGWSPHRIQRVRGNISGAFGMAVDYGWTPRNPVRDVKAPNVDRADVHAPDHDIVRRLLATAPTQIRLFLWLAATTGARRGELIAIQWHDLDDNGTLALRRSVVQTAGQPPVIREQTKTGRKGDRRLALDPRTLELLADHRATQAAQAADRGLPTPVFVFSHTGGVDPWRPDYIGLAYRRHRDAIPGAQSVRLHDLRHYVATTMLNDGEQPIDVAAQLGHATPATTLRVYAQYMPGRGRESATRRASRLSPD